MYVSLLKKQWMSSKIKPYFRRLDMMHTLYTRKLCGYVIWFWSVKATQCCGSGSESACFWASRIQVRIHHYFALIRVLPTTSQKSTKNLSFYYFVTSFLLFSMETNLIVPSQRNKQKTYLKNLFFVGILSSTDK